MPQVVTSSTPAGIIKSYAGSSVPDGFIACDGASHATSLYPALFAAIGYTYGGSGANFNVPNCQGVFLRGHGSQIIGGITYSGSLGTTQNDQVQGHFHVNQVHTWSGAANEQDNPIASTPRTLPQSAWTTDNTDTGYTSQAVSDGANGNPRVGAETYPANVAVHYCIKI